LRLVIPPDLLGRHKAAAAPEDPDAILLRRTTVYPLTTVSSHVSATEIRRRIRHDEPISGLVPPRVEEYIQKQALYR
jgi:nicotinic acid mononucleotide adenylyltransferase